MVSLFSQLGLGHEGGARWIGNTVARATCRHVPGAKFHRCLMGLISIVFYGGFPLWPKDCAGQLARHGLRRLNTTMCDNAAIGLL